MTGLWPAGWKADPARLPAAPLVLTAALPPPVQQAADASRGRLQPEAAAHAPAHLTLFRHLPGLKADELLRDIRALAAELPAPSATLGAPVRWEGLWASPASSPGLDTLREQLAGRWHGLLAPGDLSRPRLHISLGKGREQPPHLPAAAWRVPGLLLWQYGKACWTPLVACRFRR